jgi:ComF family protein
MSSVIRLALEPVWALLFPARCVLCERRSSAALCDGCALELGGPSGPTCERCAHPLAAPRCPDCARLGQPAFRRTLAVGPYAGTLKNAVLALKYRDGWRLADILGQKMAERVRAADLALDAVVPIPVDDGRRTARGYSQAELLASRVAVRLALPHRRGWLRRRAAGVVQSLADRATRHAQVEGIFEASARLEGTNVLLVDDVMTTAATMHAAGAALAGQGARVWGVVAARQTLRDGGLS